MRALVVPPAAQRDPDSVQMLSAWIAERGLHCTLNIGMWEAQGINEPEAWGRLVSDLIRHIGNALHEQTGAGTATSVDAVLKALITELGAPTSEAEGGFHAGSH